MNLMIDLFSGLGGASSAFIKDSEWSVLRYESNPLLEHVPCTILCDLKTYEIHCRHEVDLVWASPPCNEFSLGFHAPRSKAIRAGEDYEPDLSLIFRAKEIIDALNPRYWVIENVRGSIKFIEPILGPPTQIIGPYVLWGRFPSIIMPKNFEYKSKTSYGPSPLRPNLRALIPLQLSQALLDAIKNQKTLLDWPHYVGSISYHK